MHAILIFFEILLIVFALIAIHEVGHFVAGRLAGIPAGQLRVRLLTFPQHVVIRDGDGWCAPTTNMPRYIELTATHLNTRAKAFCYVAGGFAFETIVMAVFTLFAMSLGWRFLAYWTPMMSLTLCVTNLLLMDLPLAKYYGRPAGDTSGLWAIAKGPTLVFWFALVALRVPLIWLAMRPG